MLNSNKYKAFNQIINTFYNDLYVNEVIDEKNKKDINESIEIIPKIIYDSQNKEMCIEFQVSDGNNSYKIKNLIAFYDAFVNRICIKIWHKIRI